MLIDELSENERAKIQEMCQKLFHSNYITQYVFAAGEIMTKANSDYSFILSHYRAMDELLSAVGWTLCRDDSAGVIFIKTDYPDSKVTLGKNESYILFALRLIYDNKKTSASSTGQVFTTIREVEEQLSTLGAPVISTKAERKKAFTTLYNKNIIAKISGTLDELDARIAVMPAILCVISASRVKNLTELLKAHREEKKYDTV